MWDTLIRNGQCVLRDHVAPLDLAIEGGKIVELKPSLRGLAKQEIDAKGLHVFPSVIDPHVHFNEPGRTDWEGIATGSAALAAGGGTCFFDMPLNSSPPTLDRMSFDFKLNEAKRESLCDFALWGGLTPNNLDHMESLAERGVIGFKAFMSNSGIADFERADDLTLYRGMQKAKALGLPVAVHAESDEITTRLEAEIKAEGGTTWRDYLRSRPIIAEVEAISRAITLAEETGCVLHIVHVANARGAELVARAARHFHVDVTCETCPHYLTLSDEDLEHIGPRAKCAPPLRTRAEIEKLWQDLAAGRFAFVASDHSPAPESMKKGKNAFKIWGGIAGVQSTLPILLTHSPRMPLEQIGALTSTNAAERFGIAGKGQIAVGFDADLALVDVDAAYELKRDMLLDRHKLSPYVGRTFTGQVKRTISRGQTIVLDGKVVGKRAGKLLTPKRRSK